MKLLLTGGLGYIGSHTARCLLEQTDYEILIVDNLSTGFMENYEYLEMFFPKRVSFVRLDLCELEKLDKLLKESMVDSVMHFGASLVVSQSVTHPLLYYKNNVSNTTTLIDLCIKNNIYNFIFSSSAAVYGEPEPTLIPVNEDTILAPINPYGSSKMMSERVLLDTSLAIKDFNYVALRYFNVAGASMANTKESLKKHIGLGQRARNATHLIKVATECATKKRDSMSIFGDDYNTPDGSCIRDYIHIDDLASAHLCALKYLKRHNASNVFNLGYNQGYSVKEVIECVKKVSGVDFNVNIAKRRQGDPSKLIASNKKFLDNTDWKAKYNDLELIITSAYEWEKSLQ